MDKNTINHQEEENIDIRKWINMILTNWYWFIFFGIIGIACGFVFNRTKQPEFELNSLLLAESNSKAPGMEEMFTAQVFGTKSYLMNHIGILNSFSIIKQTLVGLNWQANWYKEKYLKVTDLFQDAPFEVLELTEQTNLPGVPIFISNISDSTCLIKVDSKARLKGNDIDIKFESIAKYGEIFSNRYFNFKIDKKNSELIDSESNYYFTFLSVDDLTKSYQKRLSISAFNEQSDLIELKITGNHPLRESIFLNQLIDVYIDFGLRKKNQISDNTIRFINAQLGGIVDSLQTAGDKFTDFRSQNRIVNLNQEAGLAVEQLKDLEYQESLARMRFEYYENLKKYLGDANQMEHMAAPSVVGIEDPTLNSLVVKMSELYAKRNALASSLTEINPARIAMENEINYTKQILDENLNNLISNVRLELDSFQKRKSSLNYQLSLLPKTEQNLINYKRKFDINNELYTFLMQKSAEAAITKASNLPDIQVLDYASIDTALKKGPGSNIYYLAGLVLGCCIPLFFLIAKDSLNTKINTRQEIEKNSSISIIGTIFRNKDKSDLPIIKQPHSGIAEAIRGLRTNIQFILSQNDGNVISVHSSTPGEGKSFISANLAASIALNNKNVLLIGSDLRKPRIDKIFKTENNIGLSTYIIRKNSFEEIIQETSIKNLYFIPSGPIPPNPSELLSTDNFKIFIEKAKKKFDFVLFDNAPAFMVTDPIIVGNLSDINLFVIRQNYTHKENLKMINDLKKQGTINNLFIVLNDVKGSGSTYKEYGKGYSNYQKKSQKIIHDSTSS